MCLCVFHCLLCLCLIWSPLCVCVYPQFFCVLMVQFIGEWVERMSWDSNTLSQMWNNVPTIPSDIPCKSYDVLNLQNKSANNNWCPNWALCKSLKSSWNVVIKNELAFSIWKCETQVKWPKEWLGIKFGCKSQPFF